MSGSVEPHDPEEVRRRRAPRTDRAGFALLVALVALVGVSALAAGGFLLANAERETVSSFRDSVDAFYVAQMGLSDFVGSQSGSPTEGTTTYSYDAGRAEVSVTKVGSTAGDGRLYRVASVGTADGTNALRQLELLVMVPPGTIPTPPGAIVSGAGLTRSETSGTISGEDACGASGPVAGLRAFSYSGSDASVSGEPPTEITGEPFAGFVDEAWWNGIREGDLVLHEYVVTDAGGWPDFSSLPPDAWPVVYVDAPSIDLAGTESGRGLVITKGDLVLSGDFDWDGTLLVGGALSDDGTGFVSGAVVTGLNRLRDEAVAEDDLRDPELLGTTSYQYDSCSLATLNQEIARLIEVPGTWREVF